MVIYKRLRLLLLVIGVVSFQSMVQAVGLGSIEVRSHLNELLDAVIPLSVGDDLAFKNTFAVLADINDFKRAGLDYSADLGKLRFAVERDAGGAAIVHVTSSRPIREPYVSFLLALTYPNGKVLREYTLLLDPPVYEPVHTQPSRTAPGYTSSTEPRRDTGQQESRPPREATSAPTTRAVEAEAEPEAETYREPEAESGAAEPSAGNGNDSYRVHAGDTLYAIALQSRRSSEVSVNQMMVALFRSNPDAFFRDNVNNLKQGVELAIPDTDEVMALDRDEVNQAIRSQNQLWQAYRRSAAENTVMVDQSGRRDVDSEVGESVSPRRSSNRLALLPAENEGQGSGSGEGEALQQDLARAEEELSSMKQANSDLSGRVQDLEGVTDSQKDLLSLKDAQIARLQAQLAEQREQQTGESAAGDSLADSETGTSQDQTDIAETGSQLENGQPDADLAGEGEAAGEQGDENADLAGDESAEDHGEQPAEAAAEAVENETGTEEIPSVESAATDQSGMSNTSMFLGAAALLLLLVGGALYLRQRHAAGGPASGQFSPEALISDEVALLAAVEEYPDDSGRRLALLRHYHAQGETDEYVAQAQLLKSHIDADQDPIWAEVLEMGAQVAPDDELFAAAAAASDASPVDHSKLEDTEDLSESAAGDDSWSSLSSMAGHAGDTEASAEPAADQEPGWEDLPDEFDFDTLDELDESDSGDGKTEQPSDGAKTDSLQKTVGADEVGDVVDDDAALDFTLGEDDSGLSASDDESDSTAAVDEHEGIDFESNLGADIEPADDALDELQAIGDSLDSGVDLSMEADSGDAEASGDLQDELVGGGDDSGDEIETGAADSDDLSVAESTDAVDVELGDESLFAAEDAVETKLSLAEAYLDMGDTDGAQSMLDEIMEEGSSAQKDRAKALKDRL